MRAASSPRPNASPTFCASARSRKPAARRGSKARKAAPKAAQKTYSKKVGRWRVECKGRTVYAAGAKHTYHQYTIRAPRRDALQEHLRGRGIATRIYYPIPVPSQPCFDPDGKAKGRYPVSDLLADEVLSLPVGPEHLTRRPRPLKPAASDPPWPCGPGCPKIGHGAPARPPGL